MQPFSPLKAALLWSTGALLFFSACSKQDDVTPAQKIHADNDVALIIPNGTTATLSSFGSQGTNYNNNGEYLIQNFRQISGSSFYFDFSENDAGNSSAFDIRFTGINNGDITSNDEIRFIDIDFASVVSSDWALSDLPQSSPAGTNVIGMNQVTGTGVPPAVQAYANAAGWYIYNWSAGHTVLPVAGRTLLWKRGTELYKFEIISIYQNQVTGGAFAYYTFRYKQL